MTKEFFDVPVRGGSLTVARWPGDGPIVLGLHGVTASHVLFAKIAAQLNGEVTLVAADLRGRGGSHALPGPYGMAAHAEDAAAVLDAIGVDACPVAGISMGGFVAATFAEMYPDRVSSLVLVDGGVPLGIEPPTDGSVDLDALLDQVLGPAMARLSMTFASREAYLDFWRAHPALQPPGAWEPVVEEYFDYDLAPGVTPFRSRVSAEAVRGDSADTLVHPEAYSAFERISCPTIWIRAERGLFNEIPPLYPDARAREVLAANPHMTDVFLPAVNHYTMSFNDETAATIAEQIRKAAGV
jgi:pimeloyl-ACP methyl ester carboxylesterase